MCISRLFLGNFQQCVLSSMLELRILAPADPIWCPCASNVASLMPRLYLGDGSIQNDGGGGDENMSAVNGTLAACRLLRAPQCVQVRSLVHPFRARSKKSVLGRSGKKWRGREEIAIKTDSLIHSGGGLFSDRIWLPKHRCKLISGISQLLLPGFTKPQAVCSARRLAGWLICTVKQEVTIVNLKNKCKSCSQVS